MLRMRSIEQIYAAHHDSPALRGLVAVMHEKFTMRARYALLEYEAGMEGRSECSELYRALSQTESAQIERLSETLASELERR
jgi:hypothetical protein